GGGPFSDSCYLDRIHMNFTLRYDESEVLDRCLLKLALVMSQKQLVHMKALQDKVRNAPMFVDQFCKDEDVIQVDTDHSLHNEILKNVIHHHLECGRGVCESEKHRQGFEKPTICAKSGFPLVTPFHAHIVVPPSHVEFCKVRNAPMFVDQFCRDEDRISVFDHEGIESAIILYKLEGSILLLDKEDGGCHQQL
ncbi:hypothetical protein L208DRAFT_1287910, partial [Tricholoma matsutake]